jgi:hypothetical protein
MKFKDKKVRKKKPLNVGKPITLGKGPFRMVKLSETWTAADEIQPRVYIGEEHPISKIIKFLDKTGLSSQERSRLRAGEVVGKKIGNDIRLLQIVAPESESGMFRLGANGLEQITDKELVNGIPDNATAK